MNEFNEDGINKDTGTKYDRDGFNKSGFNIQGIHKDTGTKYDTEGFDRSGYDKDYNTRDELLKHNISSSTATSSEDSTTETISVPKIRLGLFDKFKMKGIMDRANDEVLYEYVLNELEDGVRIKGLMAKAYANSEGNENKIEPLYMQYRVQAIKDRLTALEIAYNEMAKLDLFFYIKHKLS